MDQSKELESVTGGADETPTATFIVFAYNQEKFIREAVEGAFAQTYGPLEIVLSDDCSTDQTFEIMREMASNYDGPHNVKAVRTSTNLGLISHVLARGREASGDVVVVASGDDISEPERTTRIVDAFVGDPKVGAVGSWVSDIDENGRIFQERRLSLVSDGIVPRDDKQINKVVLGCSAAYRQWAFDVPLSSADAHYGEDLLLSFYVNLLGARIVSLDSPLVRYRKHAGAQSNLVDTSVGNVEGYIRRVAGARIEFLDESERIANATNKSQRIDKSEIARARQFACDATEWPDLAFRQRLKRTITADYKGELRPNLKRFAWRVVRLWGRYPCYQPKTSISRIKLSWSR